MNVIDLNQDRIPARYGGSCFERDNLNLAYLTREMHRDVVADYWMEILKINQCQQERFALDIVRELNGSLHGKKISVTLGFDFKDDTNDTRNSLVVTVHINGLAYEMIVS